MAMVASRLRYLPNTALGLCRTCWNARLVSGWRSGRWRAAFGEFITTVYTQLEYQTSEEIGRDIWRASCRLQISGLCVGWRGAHGDGAKS